MNKQIAPRIEIDSRIRFGQPVIEGTRVPVDLLVGKVAGGMSIDEVATEYEVAREDVLAALSYAAKSLSNERVHVFARY